MTIADNDGCRFVSFADPQHQRALDFWRMLLRPPTNRPRPETRCRIKPVLEDCVTGGSVP